VDDVRAAGAKDSERSAEGGGCYRQDAVHCGPSVLVWPGTLLGQNLDVDEGSESFDKAAGVRRDSIGLRRKRRDHQDSHRAISGTGSASVERDRSILRHLVDLAADTTRAPAPARESGTGEQVNGAALAVVIPAGPRDDTADTLESVLHYTHPPRLVVIVDDTGGALAQKLTHYGDDVHVVPAPAAPPGLFGGLWAKVAHGYRHALGNFDFDVLLRLDADALLIGDGIAELAAERFRSAPGVGMLGSNRLGMDGGTRDWSWPASTLAAESGLRGLNRPRMRAQLRKLRAEADEHGYSAGEHSLGGAYLQSGEAVRAMERRGSLQLEALAKCRLGDDHLFGLITYAAGFSIGEFAGPDDPLALDWKQLPAAPDELVRRGKLVIHSVRAWGDLDEAQIRAFFAARRAGGPGGAARIP
jgi:hypothetical protein